MPCSVEQILHWCFVVSILQVYTLNFVWFKTIKLANEVLSLSLSLSLSVFIYVHSIHHINVCMYRTTKLMHVGVTIMFPKHCFSPFFSVIIVFLPVVLNKVVRYDFIVFWWAVSSWWVVKSGSGPSKDGCNLASNFQDWCYGTCWLTRWQKERPRFR